ncbi:MAG: aminoacyl-histidine dipeptidase [Clostridiales bacterium]|jgi:dipeptidase D|nr:aminoacyl-histidine dipeptidase [Clostridiales bacterium]
MTVLNYFKEISKIPRGSGNEKRISDWLYGFAKERGLFVIQDAVNNIIIKKPGTQGYEDADALIIQGHMDMVCEKNADKKHDFTTDPIQLITEGDMVRADGTTLGADNGIAVAMALALLDSKDIPHPPLEILLTVDEEMGMSGAETLDGSLLAGRKLINLDTEEEGVFCVSCAGGLKMETKLPAEYVDPPETYSHFALSVKGLKGGHSGMDIVKGRANSNRLLGRVLRAVFTELDARLISLTGGMKMNAIPRESEAVIAINAEDYDKAAEIIKSYEAVFRNEYRARDPLVELGFTRTEAGNNRAFSEETTRKAIAILCLTPQGVLEMSADIHGLPETSNNLGVVRAKEGYISFACALRSSVASEKYALRSQIETLAELTGSVCESSGDYPEWEYNPHSVLRDRLVKLYEELYGRKPKVEAVHAGLECGIFTRKLPGVDMISFGPDIFDVHSPDEHFSVSSAERIWDFLTRVITKL